MPRRSNRFGVITVISPSPTWITCEFQGLPNVRRPLRVAFPILQVEIVRVPVLVWVSCRNRFGHLLMFGSDSGFDLFDQLREVL